MYEKIPRFRQQNFLMGLAYALCIDHRRSIFLFKTRKKHFLMKKKRSLLLPPIQDHYSTG